MECRLILLEAGRISDLTSIPERNAHLSRMQGSSFLLVAGDPTAAEAKEYEMELQLSGQRLELHRCGSPLLRGYLLPPAASSTGYVPLAVITRLSSTPSGAPFALHGLDYGPRSEPGFVHGTGWYYPEKDETQVGFRWASPEIRSLLHVPGGGATLVVEGVAPLEYLGTGVAVEIHVNGASRESARLENRRFRFEIPLSGDEPFQRVDMRVDRSFVPDEIQHNGDRRRLALRVYEFSLQDPPAEPAR